jgi:hypothetical protein
MLQAVDLEKELVVDSLEAYAATMLRLATDAKW